MEGTYLLQLVVNAGPLQVTNKVVLGVRDIKSLLRVPAYGETDEANSEAGVTLGWDGAVGDVLRHLLARAADPNTLVVVAGPGDVVAGEVVWPNGIETLKGGLPGEETLPTFGVVTATDADVETIPVGVSLGKLDGTSPALEGDMMLVRMIGQCGPVLGGPSSVADPVFVDDAGLPSLTQGTYRRVLGYIHNRVNGGGAHYSYMLVGWAPPTAGLPAAQFLLQTASGEVPSGIAVDDIDGDAIPFVNTVEAQDVQAPIELVRETTADATAGLGVSLPAKLKGSDGLRKLASDIQTLWTDMGGLYEDDGDDTAEMQFFVTLLGSLVKRLTLSDAGLLLHGLDLTEMDITTTAPKLRIGVTEAAALLQFLVLGGARWEMRPPSGDLYALGSQLIRGIGSGTVSGDAVHAAQVQMPPLVWGHNWGSVTAGGTKYIPFGTGTDATDEMKLPVPTAGYLRNMRVYCRTAPVGGAVGVTLKLRKNGADQALTVTLAPGEQSGSDVNSAHEFAVAAGDLLSVSITGGAGLTNAPVDLYVTCEFSLASISPP